MPEPTLPPQPTATTEVDGYDERFIEVQVPVLTGGFPPVITTQTQRVPAGRVPRLKTKDPSSDDLKQWEAQVATLNGCVGLLISIRKERRESRAAASASRG